MLHGDHGNQRRQKIVLCELGTWVFFSGAGLLSESAPRATPTSAAACRPLLQSVCLAWHLPCVLGRNPGCGLHVHAAFCWELVVAWAWTRKVRARGPPRMPPGWELSAPRWYQPACQFPPCFHAHMLAQCIFLESALACSADPFYWRAGTLIGYRSAGGDGMALVDPACHSEMPPFMHPRCSH